MADWWPFDRSWAEEWRRNWTEVLSLSSAAAASLGLPQPAALAGDAFTALVDAARTRLVGKQRTFSFDGRDLTLVLEDLSVEGPDLARAVGQYGEVRICARDVEWDGYRFGRTEIRARNVHLRPGTKPTLIAAPVLWEAFMPVAAASRWLAAVSPRLELVMQEGVPQVSMAGAPWVRLEIEAGAEGKSIRVAPRALHLLDRRVSLPAPAFHVPRAGPAAGRHAHLRRTRSRRLPHEGRAHRVAAVAVPGRHRAAAGHHPRGQGRPRP